MKRFLLNISLLLALSVVYTSCIKQTEKVFTGEPVAELDAAVLNSNTAGVTYPIITRHVPFGFPLATADSTIRRISRMVRLRINLVGPHMSEDQTVGYKLFTSPITSIAFPATATGQTPTRAAGTLAVSDAVAGTHFTALSGKATIPKGTSFAFIDIPLIEGVAVAGQGRFIGIELDNTGTIKANPNYNKIGVVIDLR
jgi:hypothetical protein